MSTRLGLRKFTLKNRKEYTLDPILFALVAFQLISTYYIATVAININPSTAILPLFMASLTVGGLAGRLAYTGITVDHVLRPIEVAQILLFGVIGFGVIGAIQTVILKAFPHEAVYPLATELTGLSATLLLANIGVAEEVFFRGFIQTAAERTMVIGGTAIAQSKIAGWIVSGVLFSLFHYVYYGQQAVLMAVFASGIVLGMLHTFTKRLSVPVLAHVLVNIGV